MLRRQTRQRREYLYKKSLESKEKQIFERKSLLKNALLNNREIPGELRNQAAEIQNQLSFDEHHLSPSTHIDDEYANAGAKDPKILITTSRDPSSRLQMFSKEMRLIFPNSQRINRGNYVTKDIVDACKSNEVTDLIILHETRGQPDSMVVCHFPYGPTAYFTLHNVVLRHDIPDKKTVSEQYPHLIFDNFNSKLGARISSILKYLFPVPKDESKRTMTFSNRDDFISFRHHVFSKSGKQVELDEIGPRFEMKPYEVRLGTVEIAEADVEWVYRPYHNTSSKREFL